MQINELTARSSYFPEQLKHISQPPKRLYWYGSHPKQWLGKPRLAVVGSRLVSPYGKGVTEKLVGELAKAGVVIVSGLALGMDAVAHRAALDNGGLTVAVLPCGLDRIYPARHRNLAIEIARSGCIITENPPGSPIFKYSFVKRNRIVSGLADALLITEAAVKSGTMHTARFALEQGATVMVVPGNITSPTSQGCNNLIKSGALPVTEAADIFFSLGIKSPKEQTIANFKGTKEERQILELIALGQSSSDEFVAETKLNATELNSILTSLELSGHIRPTGGGNWQLV